MLLRTFFPLLFLAAAGVALAQPAQVIEWRRVYGGTAQDVAAKVIRTSDGGYAVVGYTSSTDLDVSSNHGTSDVWVLKLDATGGLEWQRTYGGSAYETGRAIQQTSDGGYIIGGYTMSNDGQVSGWHGSTDIWVLKVDALGELQWQKCLGGSDGEECHEVIEHPDGGFVVAGTAQSTDGDVAGFHGGTGSDGWVAKLDATGGLEWQRALGGTESDLMSCLLIAPDDGIVVGGTTHSDDGDLVGENVVMSEAWLLKFTADGTLEWDHVYGGSGYEYIRGMVQTPGGSFVLSGRTTSIEVPDYHGADDVWLAEVDADGTFLWHKAIGGPAPDFGWGIDLTADGGYVIAAEVNADGGDVSGVHGDGDGWVAQLDATGTVQWQLPLGGPASDAAWSVVQAADGGFVVLGGGASTVGALRGFNDQNDVALVKLRKDYNSLLGTLFIDLNSDGIADAGEPPLTHHTATAGGGDWQTLSSSQGDYLLPVGQNGTITVTPAALNYYAAAPATHACTFGGMNENCADKDFAFQATTVANDLEVVVTPFGAYRPGFMAYFMIHYRNVGTTTLSPTLQFDVSDNATYVGATLDPDASTDQSAQWTLPELGPFQSGMIQATIVLDMDASGTVLGTANIGPLAGDADPLNNTDHWAPTVTGSYDPNDILVDRAQLLTTELVDPPALEYVIRFQNTGTDTAFTVRVENFLPLLTQASTFAVVGASHPVEVQFNPIDRSLIFQFDNILLPDSNTNEPLSHGFVRYRVVPNTDLVLGDSIANRASIFFDFNVPVLTNTAYTVVETPQEVSDPRTGSEISLVPNPAQGSVRITTDERMRKATLTITDVLGREVLRTSMNGPTRELDLQALPQGTYIVVLRSESEVMARRLVLERGR